MSNKYLRAMRNTITIAPEKTPFCGTCHKAGLSREEYTSHFTRRTKDPDSEIVCPLILNSVCSHCQKQGHWKKYCPDLMVFLTRTSSHFVEQKKEDSLVIEEYRSSEESMVRPSSPDFPPPWLDQNKAELGQKEAEVEPKPMKKIMSWAEIVSSKK
jgi:hypothetical protein